MEAATTDRALLDSIYSPPRAKRPWRLDDVLGLPVRYFSFGRRALAEALRLSGVGRGERVLLPGFICRDLLSSLAAVGAEPVFYAVDSRLRPAGDPKNWPEARAAIAVNYFGFPQDLRPFQDYARRAGAVLIEDNAHGLFSKDGEGRWLGTRANFGVFSLRKSLPLPDGAGLVAASRPPSSQGPYRAGNGPRFLIKTSLRPAARLLGGPAAFCALSALRRARGPYRPDPSSERDLPLPEAPCSLLAGPLVSADPDGEMRRRRALYAVFERILRAAGFPPLFDSLPEGVVPYAFPFRVAPGLEGLARETLRPAAVDPLPWPDLPAAVEPQAPAHYRDVWLAHFLW